MNLLPLDYRALVFFANFIDSDHRTTRLFRYLRGVNPLTEESEDILLLEKGNLRSRFSLPLSLLFHSSSISKRVSAAM